MPSDAKQSKCKITKRKTDPHGEEEEGGLVSVGALVPLKSCFSEELVQGDGALCADTE